MWDAAEELAFLKGIAEGSKIRERDEQGRIVAGMLDVLCALVERSDQVDFGRTAIVDDRPALEAWRDAYVLKRCPSCQELIYFDRGLLADEPLDVSCPGCGEVLIDARQQRPFAWKRDRGHQGRSRDKQKGGDEERTH